MILVTFEIQDGEHSYEQYSIFTKDMSEEKMLEEVYGDVNDWDYREYKITSCQSITKKEASILKKLHISFYN